MLILFRHRAGLDGVNILALFLQGRFGVLIVLAAVLAVPLD